MRPLVIAVSVSVKSRSPVGLPLPMMNIGAFFWSVIATNAPHSGDSIFALMPTCGELRLDRFAELAVHQVAAGRHVERGLEAVRMAGLGQQLARLGGIVGARRDLLGAADHRRLEAAAELADAAQHAALQRVDVDRMRHRLAHAPVVERRQRIVQADIDGADSRSS